MKLERVILEKADSTPSEESSGRLREMGYRSREFLASIREDFSSLVTDSYWFGKKAAPAAIALWTLSGNPAQAAQKEPVVTEETLQALDREALCLIENVYEEGRNQASKGKLAIALVTLARTLQEQYPKTVCGVVHQKSQFSWTLKKLQGLAPAERFKDARSFFSIAGLVRGIFKGATVTDASIRQAVTELAADTELPPDTLFYKRADDVGVSEKSKRIFGQLEFVGTIKDHSFYKLPGKNLYGLESKDLQELFRRIDSDKVFDKIGIEELIKESGVSVMPVQN